MSKIIGATVGTPTSPEAMGRKLNMIPAPETAKVGQCIVVAAVDENGVVTATEAVDMEILEDAAGVAF